MRNYRSHLERFALYLQTLQKTPEGASTLDIETYTGPILHKGGLGPAGRSAAISAIRGFYRFCCNRALLPANPARDLEHPKYGRALPELLSLQQIEQLMFAPDLGTLRGLRDAALMAFLFATGCRVSGAVNLNQDQLVYGGEEDPPRLYVILREKGKKERKLPLNRKAEIMIFSYLNHEELKAIDRTVGATEVVFVNLKNTRIEAVHWRGEERRLTVKSVGKILKKYGIPLGIPVGRLHPHAGRHTMGTMLYDEGMSPEDRMAWMGHTRMETLAIYSHLSEKKLLRGAGTDNPLSRVKTPIDELVRSVFAPGKVIKKS